MMDDDDTVVLAHTYVNTNALVFNNGKLCYIGQDCRRIPNILGQMYGSQVRQLDLSYNCLTSLQGIDQFPQLEELVLDNNHVGDSFELPRLPLLHTLSINKNRLVDLDSLLIKISHHVPNLRYLSLLGNVACPNQLSDQEKDEEDYRRYRYYVLYQIPSLKFLDSTTVTVAERLEAQRVGKFMKVVKPVEDKHTIKDEENGTGSPFDAPYTPLPSTMRDGGNHFGAFGKCRYRYSGKHSEGNRFIRNSDL